MDKSAFLVLSVFRIISSILLKNVESADIRIENLNLPPLAPEDNITIYLASTFDGPHTLQASEVVPNKTFAGFLAGTVVEVDVQINGIFNLSRSVRTGARKPIDLKVEITKDNNHHEVCAEWGEISPRDVNYYTVKLWHKKKEQVHDKVDLRSDCFGNLTAGNYTLIIAGVYAEVSSTPVMHSFFIERDDEPPVTNGSIIVEENNLDVDQQENETPMFPKNETEKGEMPGETLFLISLTLILSVVAVIVLTLWATLFYRERKNRYREYDMPSTGKCRLHITRKMTVT